MRGDTEAEIVAGDNRAATESQTTILQAKDLSVYYGKKAGVKNISIEIPRRAVTAFIGASGCGKSTLLREFNRMNDTIEIVSREGEVLFEGEDIHAKDVDPVLLRARVGMVFQKANPFPKSIYDNVAYGPRIHGMARNKEELDAIVKDALEKAALWDEVKERMDEPGTGLSGGQQQRLCIARALANGSEVLLMDEPTSALDPIAAGKIEELIGELKKEFTIVIVTHNMQQAKRLADKVAHFHMGELIEYRDKEELFFSNSEGSENPINATTLDYISGRFG